MVVGDSSTPIRCLVVSHRETRDHRPERSNAQRLCDRDTARRRKSRGWSKRPMENTRRRTRSRAHGLVRSYSRGCPAPWCPVRRIASNPLNCRTQAPYLIQWTHHSVSPYFRFHRVELVLLYLVRRSGRMSHAGSGVALPIRSCN